MYKSVLNMFEGLLAIAFLLTMTAAFSAAEANPPSTEQPPPADAAVSQSDIEALVRQLGDKDYYVRQRAQDALARLGFQAFEALSAAANDPDLEISARAKYLLRLMRIEWTAEGDSADVRKYLRDYEFEDARSRVARMQALAGLSDGEGVAALCRLARFEKSPVLSKSAAVALLNGKTGAQPPSRQIVETVRKSLGDCKRPAAAWLLLWTRLGEAPAEAEAELERLVADEIQLLKSSPNETSLEVVAGLARFQVAWLKHSGKSEAAIASMRRLIELERGNPETLAELLQWLIEQKAWQAVDELAQRFAPQFASQPGLLYLLAGAYADQDRQEQAEETAARALRLQPGKDQRQLLLHLGIAQQLRNRGRFVWARREFEHVISQSSDSATDELRAMAQSVLAEMLHDQGQDLDAAETLQKLVEALDGGKITEAALGGRRPSEVRSRMYYFFACHWQSKADTAKQAESLGKALQADPADVDVLIACYRLPDQTPEYRTKILDLIDRAAAALRQEIADDPEGPSAYNQFAWLIGNTEGDLDEALRYSERSLELMPDEGGFLDTLARVYYAKGDLENAVKHQTRAAELEPHSGLIRRQLDFFSKALEESKSQQK